MAKLERTYIIPLRREVQKVPDYKRAKKAITAIKGFLERHMKSADIKVGNHLNLLLWEKGIKNPPPKVKVTAIRDEKGTVKVELFGKKYEEKKREAKVQKTKMQEALEKAGIKKDQPKEEGSVEKTIEKEEKKTEAKPEVKKETPKEVKPEEKKEVKPAEEKK